MSSGVAPDPAQPADADEVERQALAQRHPLLAAIGDALAHGRAAPASPPASPPAPGAASAAALAPEVHTQSAPRERTPEEWLDEADSLYPAGRPCPCTTCRFARQAVQLQRQVVALQRAAEAPEGIGEAAVNRPPGYIVRGVDIPPGWMLVRLETAAGDYVIAARVPAFLTLPAVLVWGDRTFALSRRAGGGGYHAHYRECFTVVVLQVADVEEDAAPQPSPGGEPLLSALPEPPMGEHWWGTGGTCARCHARASLAMNSACAWRPPAAPPQELPVVAGDNAAPGPGPEGDATP